MAIANLRLSAHSVAMGASKVKLIVINALMAVSGEAADMNKRKVYIIGLDLKNS